MQPSILLAFWPQGHIAELCSICSPGPPGLFLPNCFLAGCPPACSGAGAVLPQVQDSVLLLVELHAFPVRQFLQLVQVPLNSGMTLCNSCHCSQFCVIGKLSAPSSRSVMKMFNSIGPSTEPWDTLLVTGLQLDFMALITTL